MSRRIFIAGHNGMVGRAVHRAWQTRYPNDDILTADRASVDLTRQAEVEAFMAEARPDRVIIAAAKVGGIHANATYPADFIYANLMIASHVIKAAYDAGVSRLLNLGSSCIYPRLADQPMREAALLTGPLEPTNAPYALAKIAAIKLCEAFNRQHGTDFRSLMPTNLYGPFDNFHPENSHVIPALLQRFHAAKLDGAKTVLIWGSGCALREFLHVDDMASACLFAMDASQDEWAAATRPTQSHVNIGTGDEVSIKTLAEMIGECVSYKGEIIFDTTKPDGAPRKRLDTSVMDGMGWRASVNLRDGLAQTYDWFLSAGNIRR